MTLNRPKVLNALNKATIAELRGLQQGPRGAAVRGVILTGAGDKAFAAGADISEMANDTRPKRRPRRDRGNASHLIENLGKPVIAAVNGFALGRRLRDWRWLARSDWPSKRPSSASPR